MLTSGCAFFFLTILMVVHLFTFDGIMFFSIVGYNIILFRFSICRQWEHARARRSHLTRLLHFLFWTQLTTRRSANWRWQKSCLSLGNTHVKQQLILIASSTTQAARTKYYVSTALPRGHPSVNTQGLGAVVVIVRVGGRRCRRRVRLRLGWPPLQLSLGNGEAGWLSLLGDAWDGIAVGQGWSWNRCRHRERLGKTKKKVLTSAGALASMRCGRGSSSGKNWAWEETTVVGLN